MISGKPLSGCDPVEALPSSSCSSTCPRVVAEQERRGRRASDTVGGAGASGDAPKGGDGSATVHACFCNSAYPRHEPRPQTTYLVQKIFMYDSQDAIIAGSVPRLSAGKL